MPVQYPGSRVNTTTTAGAWKKVFTARKPYSSGAAIFCKESATSPLYVASVQAGQAPPSDPDMSNDAMYVVEIGQTYPLGRFADHRSELYVRSKADDVQPFGAWETKNS